MANKTVKVPIYYSIKDGYDTLDFTEEAFFQAINLWRMAVLDEEIPLITFIKMGARIGTFTYRHNFFNREFGSYHHQVIATEEEFELLGYVQDEKYPECKNCVADMELVYGDDAHSGKWDDFV